MKRLYAWLVLVVSLVSLSVWSVSAQDTSMKLPAPVANYLTQVAGQLKTVDTNINIASDFLGGKNSKTKDDVLKAKAQLEKMSKDIDGVQPPVQALGLHAQLGFALKDCAQFVDTVSQSKGKADVNAFSISVFLAERNQCATDMHATILRMLDIYSAAGVVPPK